MSDLMIFLQQNILLVIALFLVLGFLVYEECGSTSSYTRLSPQGAVALINRKQAKVLDLRNKGEFNAGHVAGSIHLPLADFSVDHRLLAQKKDRPLIVLAGHSKDGLAVFSKLKKAGFSNVYMLKGGLSAWVEAQMPLIKK